MIVAKDLLLPGDCIKCKNYGDFAENIMYLTKSGCSVMITPEDVKDFKIRIVKIEEVYKNGGVKA